MSMGCPTGKMLAAILLTIFISLHEPGRKAGTTKNTMRQHRSISQEILLASILRFDRCNRMMSIE